MHHPAFPIGVYHPCLFRADFSRQPQGGVLFDGTSDYLKATDLGKGIQVVHCEWQTFKREEAGIVKTDG